MENEGCCAWNPTKTELMLIKLRDLRHDGFMLWHKIAWKVLWFTRLAVPYSKWACRNNYYRKFPDGRCHWCGNKH